MVYKIVENGSNRKFIFNLTDEDTCMKTWEFDLSITEEGSLINELNIDYTGRGCKGHPKTISALLKNRELTSIDTKLLSENTPCARSFSCGKALGHCIDDILKNLQKNGL